MNRRLSEIDGAINLAEQRQGTARERQAEIAHRDMVLDGEINQGRLRREELAKLSEEIQVSLAEEAETSRQSAGILEATEASYNEKSGLLNSVQNVATEVQNALWKNTQDRTKLNNDLVAQRSLESGWKLKWRSTRKIWPRLRNGWLNCGAIWPWLKPMERRPLNALVQAESAVNAAQAEVAARDQGLTEAQVGGGAVSRRPFSNAGPAGRPRRVGIVRRLCAGDTGGIGRQPSGGARACGAADFCFHGGRGRCPPRAGDTRERPGGGYAWTMRGPPSTF
jgi:hypothetical protein